MAKQERRGFTREFKLEAVRAAIAGDERVTDGARELGVNPEQIHRWRRLFEQRPEKPSSGIFPDSGKLTSQDDELRRLRRELAKDREERDILKRDCLLRKAIALNYAFIEHHRYEHTMSTSAAYKKRQTPATMRGVFESQALEPISMPNV